MSDLYDSDLYAWASEQSELLRERRFDELDVPHLIEALTAMGRSEWRELVNRLAILITHLLKWRLQPALRGNSWRLTIKEQRLRLAAHLEDNPSLKGRLEQAIARAYPLARIAAERETGLPESAFAKSCPFSLDEILDEGFWPD